jgi:hypothetical protein
MLQLRGQIHSTYFISTLYVMYSMVAAVETYRIEEGWGEGVPCVAERGWRKA